MTVRETSKCLLSLFFLSLLSFCFVLFFCFLSFILPFSSLSSTPLHPPPLAFAVGLLSSPSHISYHCITCLAQCPSQFPPVWKMFFFICFMQISPSNTQGISKKNKSLVTFFSHIHAGRFPTVQWKCLCTLAFCSLLSHGFL